VPSFREHMRRLTALEQTPLARAHDLQRRQVPPEQWPDAELNAYVEAHCGALQHLTDAELDALIAETTTEEEHTP
jgi:hypothetical protein